MKLKPISLYFLFFLFAVVIFLFLLFPERKVAGSISRSLTTINPNVRVSIDNVKLGLPFKLVFENTKLLLNKTTQIVPESFEVFLGPAFIFNTKRPIGFQSDIYEGSLNGSLRLDNMDPFLFSQAELFMSNVKINDFRYKTGLADITLGCEVSGSYKQIEASGKKKSGQGTILCKKFTAKMTNSFFNTLKLPVVDFTDIKLEFTQSENRVTITQCLAKGSIINVKFKGSLEMMFPLQKTKLDLTGIILPDSPYLAKFANTASIKSVVKNISKKGIGFNIKGTLENPEIGI